MYGPHIFHTNNETAWDYMNHFTEMMLYVNRVKTTVNGSVYSLPINLYTIDLFFNKALPPTEAKNFISNISMSDIVEPVSFEKQALKFIGEDLYKASFYGYTKKRWGVEPKNLLASILKRLSARFNYNDNYFNHPYQGMPHDGYTENVIKILNHDHIEVRLNTKYEKLSNEVFDRTIYCGPIDRYFDYKLGRLGYRTLKFKKIVCENDYKGTAIMNYGNEEIPYTHITEHKRFTPWEPDSFSKTICYKEYSSLAGEKDIPY